MSRVTRRLAVTLAAATVATAVPVAVAATGASASEKAPAAQPAAACQTAWGTKPKTLNVRSTLMSTQSVGVRTGRHTCFDRVVFDLKGKVGAVVVGYPDTPTNPMGLAVVSTTGLFPKGSKVGTTVKANLPAVKGVVFAGTQQDVDAAAVVTAKKLPFRLFVVKGPGTHNRVVLDVAHR